MLNPARASGGKVRDPGRVPILEYYWHGRRYPRCPNLQYAASHTSTLCLPRRPTSGNIRPNSTPACASTYQQATTRRHHPQQLANEQNPITHVGSCKPFSKKKWHGQGHNPFPPTGNQCSSQAKHNKTAATATTKCIQM